MDGLFYLDYLLTSVSPASSLFSDTLNICTLHWHLTLCLYSYSAIYAWGISWSISLVTGHDWDNVSLGTFFQHYTHIVKSVKKNITNWRAVHLLCLYFLNPQHFVFHFLNLMFDLPEQWILVISPCSICKGHK